MNAPRATGRTVDMSPEEPFEYTPPAGGQMLEYPVNLGGGHELVVRQQVYRELIVDFAIMARYASDGEVDETHRIDCCHSEVHGHQHFRNRSSGRYVIVPINRDQPWRCVDAQFLPCHDRAIEHYVDYWERWRSS